MLISTSLKAKLKNLETHLLAHIRGQDHLLPRVVSVLRRGELGLTNPSRPKGSFLLVGPTGVGKTEVTNTFTDYLFGPNHLHRFDMSEFQNQSSVGLLLGQNRDDAGMLGRALANNTGGTLLFDEIEKAHPLVLDLFLQILDAARITLATGETKDLHPYYVVCTSNIGATEAMRMENSSFATIERTVLNRVDQTLRPELVGRINEKVVFARLDYDVQREICDLMTQSETDRLKAAGYDLDITEGVTTFLMQEGFHRKLGARPMRNAVDTHLQDAIVDSLLFRNEKGNGRVCVNDEGRRLFIR